MHPKERGNGRLWVAIASVPMPSELVTMRVSPKCVLELLKYVKESRFMLFEVVIVLIVYDINVTDVTRGYPAGRMIRIAFARSCR